MIYLLVLIAILVGALMPVQAGLNALLTKNLHHPYLAAFVSLTVGALAVLTLILIQGGMGEIKRLPQIPLHLFLGGLLGALFVGSSLYLVPKMGATIMVGSFVVGQLLGSLLIDHFGLLGLSQHPLNPGRIIGVILLFVGLILVVRKAP